MSFQVNEVAVNPPVGTILAYVNVNIPNGWLRCNGQTISSTNYPDLYTFLGGSGVGSLNLPNLNAVFLRGIGNTSYNGITYNGQTNVREIQNDSIRSHTHNIVYSKPTMNGGGGQAIGDIVASGFNSRKTELSSPGLETRPLNYGIVWIIKA